MQVLIAVIVGLVVGGLWNEGFGAVVGAVLAWLLVRSGSQARAIAELRRALAEMRAARAADSAPVAQSATPQPAPSVQAAPVPEPVVDTVPTPLVASHTAAQDTPGAATQEPYRPWAPAAQATPAASDPLGPVKQWLFGGNTIVKVGVAILFIGLAFLAKFASEHVHVPIEMRLAGIGAVGVVLLVLGWRLRQRRSGYAQVLQGGAVAVLYLTLFVAFRFYGVLSALPVFALMVLVAALAAALAVLQDAKPLAVIGALGGFATPLLVSTGSGNHVALFSYYLVLDLGIAAVAWHRTWRSLNLIGFLGTFIVGTAWGVLKYQSEHYASCQAFLIAYFVLFVAIMLMPARQAADAAAVRRDWPGEHWVHGSLLFGLPTITFVLQYGLVRHTEYGVALSALALAAFYVALARWMRGRARMAQAFEGSLAVGTVFVTLVIPFALDARSTAGAWALEGAGLLWLGFRQSRVTARVFGYALLLLGGLTLVFAHGLHGTPTTVFNALFFNAVLTAIAALIAALTVRRHAAAAPRDAIAEPLLIAWGTLWLLAAAAVQIDAFVPGRYGLSSWLCVFSAIALLYTLLSRRLQWPRIGLPVLAHAPLHAIGVAAVAVTSAAPLQHGGVWAWPLALLTHAVVLRTLAPQWERVARDGVHALGVLIVAGLGALQGRVLTAHWGDASSAWPWLGWLVVPAVLLVALPRPALARRWPVSEVPSVYQGAVAAVLSLGLLLWALLANLGSNGSALPLPHVPLLNPLDVGIGLALAASWAWARSDAARPLLSDQPSLAPVLLAGSAFVWLNAMLIRAFHH
ncbi:MAG TPA: DUF2339 domain-containing protein, partial [Burkholderiaceae bacterium]